MLDLGHVLFGGPLFREGPGQHELGFENGSNPFDDPVEGRRHAECFTRRWTSPTVRPVLRSYQVRLRSSVTFPSCTMRLPDRSSGPASPRFSRHSRMSAASSSPIMTRASEPPMKVRLLMESASLKLCWFIELSCPQVFCHAEH